MRTFLIMRSASSSASSAGVALGPKAAKPIRDRRSEVSATPVQEADERAPHSLEYQQTVVKQA
ncbi:unnamed protein product [Ixodes persulcatus]